MLALLLLGAQVVKPLVSIEEVDKALHDRNVTVLNSYLAPKQAALSPFSIIATGGAYGVGVDGWHALALESAKEGRHFLVVTTRLTSEDTGELLFERTPQGLAYVPETERLGVKILKHNFDVVFDIPKKTARIHDQMSLETDGKSPDFFIRLAPNYRMKAVVNAQEKTVPFTQAGGIVSIPNPVAGTSALTLFYEAVVDSPRFAGSISETECTLTNELWVPTIGRLPAPYEAAIHCQPGWTAIAQGEFTGRDAFDKEQVFHYKMDLPICFYSLSAGKYHDYSTSIHGRVYTVHSLHLPDDMAAIQCQMNAEMLETFERLFGKYPFGEWSAVISDVYGDGMLEAYSFATYQNGILPSCEPHEISHTWWGGLVPNDYLTSFWNESFANFSEAFYRRNSQLGDPSERTDAFREPARAIDEWEAGAVRSSGASTGPTAYSLGYGKGAYILQYLESRIGTETMAKCLKAFVVQHEKGTVGSWDEFEAVTNKLTNGATKEFFKQWLDQAGSEDFEVSEVSYNGREIVGRLEFKGDLYEPDLPMMVQYPGGGREFVTPYRIDKEAPGRYRFYVHTSAMPTLLSVDPWLVVPRKIKADEFSPTLAEMVRRSPRVTDLNRPTYGNWLPPANARHDIPPDPNGLVIVGHPDSLPGMAALCDKAGFKVDGNTLTYRGTTIDMRLNAALAIVDLGSGKQCAIVLGSAQLTPETGRARVAIVDSYGRLVRAQTEPKTKGWGVFRLGLSEGH
ncbi:MAG: hypothetical protein JSS72_10380 [Armatimonadetes bacterium]|nr:hypothetical protein [Armatimonadota bacterium]